MSLHQIWNALVIKPKSIDDLFSCLNAFFSDIYALRIFRDSLDKTRKLIAFIHFSMAYGVFVKYNFIDNVKELGDLDIFCVCVCEFAK